MRTIEEKNRMIAEFMGMQETKIGWYDAEENLPLEYTTDNTFDELLFNKSWEWLMPVVEKISELGYEFQIDANETYFKECDGDYEIVASAFNGSVLGNTFEAVLQFIEKHGNNN